MHNHVIAPHPQAGQQHAIKHDTDFFCCLSYKRWGQENRLKAVINRVVCDRGHDLAHVAAAHNTKQHDKMPAPVHGSKNWQ